MHSHIATLVMAMSVAASLASPLAVHAAVIVVPADYPSIQEAVTAAASGDEIRVGNGVWSGPSNRNIDFGGKFLSVRSLNGPEVCIIDCEDEGSGFALSPGSAGVIEGFTIGKGLGSPHGGGVSLSKDSSVLLRKCKLVDCHAPDGAGGGVFSEGAIQVHVEECEFRNCTAGSFGGAIEVNDGVALTITNTLILGNESGLRGGGVAVFDLLADFRIEQCSFVGNSTLGAGGGLYLHGPIDGSILHTRFDANVAFDPSDSEGIGGGAYLSDESAATFVGVVFAGNVAEQSGGGLFSKLGTVVHVRNGVFTGNTAGIGGGLYAAGVSDIRSCTFVANSAPSASGPGGVAVQDRAVLANSVAWGNTAAGGTVEAQQVRALGMASLTMDACCVEGLSGDLGGEGNIGGDPMFVDPAGPDGLTGTYDDNLRLGPGSSCIDAGDSGLLPDDVWDLDDDGVITELLPLDAAGFDRTLDDPGTKDVGVPDADGVVTDMGAYEFTEVTPPSPDIDGDGDVDAADLALLLGAWGTKSPEADLNLSGLVGPADLAILLGAWST